MTAPFPENEAQRLSALRSYRILDTEPEPAFDDLTLLAAQVCETPIALVSLVDEKRQWFKARLGMGMAETSRGASFCAHTILHADQILEVRDAREDPRFADSELVASDPPWTFYAGAPLVAWGGHALGALCVVDKKPRVLRAEQLAALRALSRQVVDQLELRRQSRQLVEEISNREQVEDQLRQQNERLAGNQVETLRLLDLAEQSRGALLSILEDEQRTSEALSRSNRALKMLSSCNEALILAQDETSLLKQICGIAVELGGYRMAWVGYAQQDLAKSILPMADWDDDTGYLAEVALSWAPNSPMGLGPAGRCIRGGEAVFCKDIAELSCHFPTEAAAEKRGYRGVSCLPLRDGSRTFGLLCLYAGEIREVGQAEVKLLQELADDLAFGIGAIRSRVVRERTEEALVASLREKEALLKEVHHRVKNNLQVIASLLRLEGRRIDHDITKSVLTEMQGRIQSMALLHETLYRSGNFATIDLASYLSQLVNQLFRSLGGQPGAVRLILDLAPVQLDIDQAIPCGLIVNELASNSFKHGFPDGRTGDLWISLSTLEDGSRLSLSVKDSGVGLSADFDSKRQRSLGLQLVSDLARQLQGSLKIGPGPEAVFEVIFNPTPRPATAETAALDGQSPESLL